MLRAAGAAAAGAHSRPGRWYHAIIVLVGYVVLTALNHLRGARVPPNVSAARFISPNVRYNAELQNGRYIAQCEVHCQIARACTGFITIGLLALISGFQLG